MKEKKLALINENTSPLFRIMSTYNWNSPGKVFRNNICAFHIGNGIIVSVAHNLPLKDRLPPIISNAFFQNEILAKIPASEHTIFNQIYPGLQGGTHRVLTGVNQPDADARAQTLDTSGVDRSFTKLYADNCCKPFLMTTFRDNAFCGDAALNAHFNPNHFFPEPNINRHTFMIELEILDTLYNEDIAIYRMVNTHQDIIAQLPSIQPDFRICDTDTKDFYCLQPAPFSEIGRIINKAYIEGLIDSFAYENSKVIDGLRYLIKGYFRFGSSGALYLIYDDQGECFKVNAIQSQASHIQLAINNKMEGNFQYVNGVASPLSLVEATLTQRLNEANP